MNYGIRCGVKIITISGTHKGVGKTALACEILKILKGFGAIKTTVSKENISVTANEEAIKTPGKDTALLMKAGAEKVILVSSPRKDLGWALKIALGMVSGCRGVIIEGTSVLDYIKSDVAILIKGRESSRTGRRELLPMKESAKKALRKVDLIISPNEFNKAVKFAKQALKNNP